MNLWHELLLALFIVLLALFLALTKLPLLHQVLLALLIFAAIGVFLAFAKFKEVA